MSKETQNNEEIANNQFAEWETPGEVFFEKTEVVPTAQKVAEQVANDKIAEEVEEEEENEIDPDKDYVFKFGDENEDEEEEEESEIPGSSEKPATGKLSSKATLEFLKEKGIVDYTLEEGTELTDELAEEILEDSREASIEAAVEETIKDLPDAVKALIKFVNKGGDYTEMLSSMVKQSVSGINKDLDMDTESNQILVITQERKLLGYDQETIDEEITYLKESGKLKGLADKLLPKALERQETEIKNRVKTVEIQKAEAKEKQKAYKSEITAEVSEAEDIKGIVINKSDKETLPSYISDANVKLQDGRVVTKFQQELFSIFGDKQKTILLAKLIKSDFDFSSITNKEITKFSKNIKENIQNTNIKVTGSKGSSQKQKKSLVDLLD